MSELTSVKVPREVPVGLVVVVPITTRDRGFVHHVSGSAAGSTGRKRRASTRNGGEAHSTQIPRG